MITYLCHRTEVDRYLQEREQEAAETRRMIEARSPTPSREQLLARQELRRREAQSL